MGIADGGTPFTGDFSSAEVLYFVVLSVEVSIRLSWERRRWFMHVAMAVAFAMILVAPFFGRWRANVWLKANMPEEKASARVPETA